MKTLRILFLSLFLIAIFGEAGAQTEEGSITPAPANTVIQSDTIKFTIYGMDCPGCEGGLEKQVNKIPAIKSSTANWMKQELLVVLRKDSVLNINELEGRVEKANFSLEKNSLPEIQ
jgi:copper chaperone CopZ